MGKQWRLLPNVRSMCMTHIGTMWANGHQKLNLICITGAFRIALNGVTDNIMKTFHNCLTAIDNCCISETDFSSICLSYI
jgi:hypothetical protein